jgi:hypothetical protein
MTMRRDRRTTLAPPCRTAVQPFDQFLVDASRLDTDDLVSVARTFTRTAWFARWLTAVFG